MMTEVKSLKNPDCVAQFSNPDILQLALTHRSARIEIQHPLLKSYHNNEQLEFLGDAIINLFVTESLMINYPQDSEGELSKKRSHIVDQKTLADKAIEFQFDQLLKLGNGEKDQKSHLQPRVLASTFEAVVGGLFIDSGIEKAKNFLSQCLKHNISNVSESDFNIDYKTQLQELTKKINWEHPHYKLISSSGPSHQPQFIVALEVGGIEKSRGIGRSKKSAEQQAAEIVLKIYQSRPEKKSE